MPELIKTVLDDLTYTVNGLAMEVQNGLKPGHRESVYQRRLAERLAEANLSVEIEKRIEVYINDSLVGYMYLDLWVEQALVIECKAHSHPLTDEAVGQVVTYLAATGGPVGMLYNFGRQKLEFKRILPPKDVQTWHKHLYRCVWTPPGQSLPPVDTLNSHTPIRFSVVSQTRSASSESSVSIRSSAPHPLETSASIRSSAPHPLETSASIRSSAPHPLETSSYAAAGVNIDAGNRAVELMRGAVKATYGPEVLAGIGAFGGLFDAAPLQSLHQPALVASTDGVGTKVKLAAQAGRYDSIGHDMVNHCIDDILVQGARPLFFLDYIASSKLDPEMVAAVVTGMAAACRVAGCALLGGETAEMPGVYVPGEFDVAGTIVGVVERDRILPRTDLNPGDVLIGLRSSGPHTNGYSLIRKIFENVPLDTVFPELGIPLADALLAPHRSYLPVLQSEIQNPQSKIKALAHLTGGGFIENMPRVFPENIGAEVRLDSWPAPPLFMLIQQRGEISTQEMHRVFNMGIGMVVVVAPENAEAFQKGLGEETWRIGQLVAGDKKVALI